MRKSVLFPKLNHRKLDWLHDGLFFLVVLVAVFLMFRFVIGVSVISGESMEPTLYDGQRVVYLRINKNPEVGDLLCIWVPSGDYYIKRVVAKGNDVVDLRDGNLYVNNELVEEDFTKGETFEDKTSSVLFPYTVRENNYFVLGDNRSNSEDSRHFGEISKYQIHGVVIYVF